MPWYVGSHCRIFLHSAKPTSRILFASKRTQDLLVFHTWNVHMLYKVFVKYFLAVYFQG